MNQDKALLTIDVRTVIEIIAEKLKSTFDNVIVSANNYDNYTFLNLPIINDIYLKRGPLAGIHACLKASKTEKNFMISCDLPLITIELIEYIINYKSEEVIVLPKSQGRIQQLCGIYSKSLLTEVDNLLIESQIPNSKLKGSIFELIERTGTELVNVDMLDFYNSNLFLNLNTPEDYIIAKSILEQK